MLVMAWSSKAPEGTMTAYLARVKMQEGTMIKRSRVKGCNDQEIKSHEGRTGERKHMYNRHNMNNKRNITPLSLLSFDAGLRGGGGKFILGEEQHLAVLKNLNQLRISDVDAPVLLVAPSPSVAHFVRTLAL